MNLLEHQVENPEFKCQEKFKKRPQIIAAVGANMGAFAFGNVISWSATGVPSLENDFNFTGDGLSLAESSWISSIITLGALAACLPAGLCVDKFGRKSTMLFACFPLIAGWLLMSFSRNIFMLIVARFITGFFAGIFSLVAPMFVAETSEHKIRGMLSCGYDTMLSSGMLFQLVAGTFLNWRMQCLVSCAIPLSIFAILFYVPESPRYLLEKGHEKRALENLAWFRGVSVNNHQLIDEMNQLSRSIETDEEAGLKLEKSRWKELLDVSTRRPLQIGLILFLFQVLSGVYAVMFYRVEIFQSADVVIPLSDHTCAILVEAVDVIISIFCLSLIERFGRKKLMIVSEMFMALALIGLGTFFLVKQHVNEEYAEIQLDWLPLTSLLFLVIGYSIGMGPIPYIVIAEIFPQKVRGLAVSILTACLWGMAFLEGRFFENVQNLIGEGETYWIFGFCCIFGAVYIFNCVPETKGKRLEEIQLVFSKSN